MSELLKLSGPNHEAMVKEALLGLAGKLLGKVGRNPLKSVGAYFNTKDVVAGAGKLNQQSGIGRSLGSVASNTPGIGNI